jgi:hypothetical protein
MPFEDDSAGIAVQVLLALDHESGYRDLFEGIGAVSRLKG